MKNGKFFDNACKFYIIFKIEFVYIFETNSILLKNLGNIFFGKNSFSLYYTK